MRPVDVYMTLWSVYRLYETVGGGNHTMNWCLVDQLGIALLCLLTLCFRSLRIWMFAMLLVFIVDLRKVPFHFDSEYWCTLTNLTVVLATFERLGLRRFMNFSSPLTDEEKEGVYRIARPSIALQMAMFYSAAMFWKLNWDFLHPHSSCAPIFAVALVDRMHIPISKWFCKFLVDISPVMTVLGEGFIGFSLFTNPSRGVLAAIVLHTAVAASPPPLNVAPFSLMCLSRLVCCLPDESATNMPLLWKSKSFLSCTIVLTAVAISMSFHEKFFDVGFPLFAFVTPFVAYGTIATPGQSSPSRKEDDKATASFAAWFPLVFTFVYSFLLIPLGLMDQGQPHMFANLRMHGGSNHILGVPTGMLQTFGTSTFGILEQGIIRIEASTSDVLIKMYPSEFSGQLTTRTREMLQAGGHTGRIFIPMLTVCTASQGDTNGGRAADFIKYTMPSHEFRRVLAVIRDTELGAYEIEFTHLTSGTGDEEWRALAEGRRMRIREDKGLQKRDCTVVTTREPCHASDYPNLPDLPGWVGKLLLFQPYPIIPDDHMLHCFGP